MSERKPEAMGVVVAGWLKLVALGAAISSAPCAIASDLSVSAQSVAHKTSYEYIDGTLQLKSITIEPDGAASLKQKTTYTYTAAGNRSTETVTGWAGGASDSTQDRGTSIEWEASGRFLQKVTNALQHSQAFSYDAGTGQMVSRVDANGQKTVWEYDAFGRKTKEKRGYSSADATTYSDYTQWTYERCSDRANGCGAVQDVSPAYVVTEVMKAVGAAGAPDYQVGPATYTYFDILNRKIRVETQVLTDPNMVGTAYVDTVFDAHGNPTKVSQPYLAGGSPAWTKVDFDQLARKTGETAPNSQYTSIDYSGLITTSTTLVGGEARIVEVTENAQGQRIKVKDALGAVTNYVYDATGGIAQTIGAYGHVVKTSYDLRGRKTQLEDPDLGLTTFTENSFGEVVTQSNALGKTSTLAYDALGRVTARTDADLVTTYSYDPANGNGMLGSVSASNGYCREQTYDSYSRPSTTTLKIGTGSAACTDSSLLWVSKTTYDGIGRIDTQTLPTGFKTQYAYDATVGVLVSVKGFTGDVEGATYWSRTSGDAFGHITAFKQGSTATTQLDYDADQMGWLTGIVASAAGGSGNVQKSIYKYNGVGQLSQRDDVNDGSNARSERFQVDVGGRLTSFARYFADAEISGSRVSVTYDTIGRIKSKSDVGVYYYAGAQAGQPRPNAVTGIRGGTTEADFQYDAAGYMTGGNNRIYVYSDAGLLRMAGDRDTCHEFLTEGEGIRVSQVIYGAGCSITAAGAPNNAGSPILSRTIYMHPDAANGLSFERETKGGVDSYKHYINVNGRPVALVLSSTSSISATTPLIVEYLHYDRLGSIVAVTNANGTVTERRSFDPWGRPSAVNGSPGSGELPNGLASEATDRGFTLHEHLEGLGLIHMNGRIFDPMLARFTSADPNVTDSYNPQNYDRYAYVLNRPLDGTDPTGFEFTFDFGASAASGSSSATTFSFGVTMTFTPGGGAGNSASGFFGNAQAGAFASTMWGNSTATQGTSYIGYVQYSGSSAAIQVTGLPADSSDKFASAADGNLAFVAPVGGIATLRAAPVAEELVAAKAITGVTLGTGVTVVTASVALKGDTVDTPPIIYVTYTRTNLLTGKVYSGRSSGSGDPNQIVALRTSQQQILTAEGFLPGVLDKAVSGDARSPYYSQKSWAYMAIRGREQQLIDFNHGAQSVGGASRNAINGISDFNPMRSVYINAATALWGSLPDNSPQRVRW